MESVLNELMVKLEGKITDQDLVIVKKQLEIFLKDYNLVRRETALVLFQEDLFKELKEYLVSLKIQGLSDKTLKQYKSSLQKFLCNVNKPCTEIETNDVRAYLYNLKQFTGMKDVSLNNQRTYICAFYKWLVDNDYLTKNPCANIKVIKHEKHTRHSLSGIDMEKLRDACKNERDRALIEFLYATACRCEELVNVKISDVDFDSKEVLLFGKGRKERISYLNARAVVAIQKYLEKRKGNSEYLFCKQRAPYSKLTTRTIEKEINKIGEKAGVSVSPHIIRHTTATDAIGKGMPIEQVQRLLGHESISTTLIYAKVSQKNVKNGHEKYIV